MQDWIELTRCVVEMVIGVLPSEQLAPQPVELEVGLTLDLERAGDHDALGATVNYAVVCDDLLFLAQSGHWRLLETFALAVLRHLLAPPAEGEERAQIAAVRFVARKPNILGGAAVPGIVMTRDAEWRAASSRALGDQVIAEILAETGAVGAYRVTFAPGASLQVPHPVSVRVVAGSVATAKVTLAAGQHAVWTGEQPLTAEGAATVLVVARPPLTPPPGSGW